MHASKTFARIFIILQSLSSRPLLLLGVSVLLPGLCPSRLCAWILALSTLPGLVILYRKRQQHPPLCLLLGLSLLLVLLASLRVAAFLPPRADWEGKTVVMEGRLGRLLSQNAEESRLLWEFTSRQGLRLALESGPELFEAASLRAELQLQKAEGASNPGGFDQRQWLAGRGIAYSARIKGTADILSYRRIPFDRMRFRMLRKIEEISRLYLGEEASGLYLALAFSLRSALDPELKAALQWLGLSHLFSVSGMHLIFLLTFLRRLDRSMSRRNHVLLSLPLSASYLLLAGRPAGLERALNLYLCRESARACRFHASPLSLLGAAALLASRSHPFALRDRGFLFSYAAAAALFYLSPVLETKLKHRLPWAGKRFRSVLASLLAAQATVLLISLGERRILHLSYLLFQPAFIASASFLFILTPCCLLLACLTSSAIPAYPAFVLLRLYAQVCRGLCRLPPWLSLPVSLGFPSLLALLLWLLSLSSFFQANTEGAGPGLRRVLVSLMLVLLLHQGFWPLLRPAPPRFIFFDVGEGDGMLLTWNGHALLIDGGREEKALSVWLPAFLALGIDRADAAILTHAHSDHTGAAGVLARLGRVRELAASEDFAASEIWNGSRVGQDFWRQMRQLGLPWRELKVGEKIGLSPSPSIVLTVLRASGQAGEREDENSFGLMLSLDIGRLSLLLTADATAEKEERYCLEEARQAQILKVAHHGAKTASSAAFLDCVRPLVAFLPVGTNPYGHPHVESLQRLAERGISTVRGDRDGAFCIRIEQNGCWLTSWKERKKAYWPFPESRKGT